MFASAFPASAGVAFGPLSCSAKSGLSAISPNLTMFSPAVKSFVIRLPIFVSPAFGLGGGYMRSLVPSTASQDDLAPLKNIYFWKAISSAGCSKIFPKLFGFLGGSPPQGEYYGNRASALSWSYRALGNWRLANTDRIKTGITDRHHPGIMTGLTSEC
jgi:hypothetical protein